MPNRGVPPASHFSNDPWRPRKSTRTPTAHRKKSKKDDRADDNHKVSTLTPTPSNTIARKNSKMATKIRNSIFVRDDADYFLINETPIQTETTEDSDDNRAFRAEENQQDREFLNRYRLEDRDTTQQRTMHEINRRIDQHTETHPPPGNQNQAAPKRRTTDPIIPVHRGKSIQEEIQSLRRTLSTPIKTTNTDQKETHVMDFLPVQKQQLQRELTGVKNEEEQMEKEMIMIEYMEKNATTREALQMAQEMRNKLIESVKRHEEKKKQVLKAQTIASRYRINYDMPTYQPPPPDFRRDKSALDFRTVHKYIAPIFDPAINPGRQLRHVWDKVLVYGQMNYLNENEHKQVLQMALSGEPLDTFNIGMRRGDSLEQIVDYLITLYDTSKSMTDYKKDLNTFSREKDESIHRMAKRYRNNLEKIRGLYTEAEWPHISRMKMIMAIKMYITTETRRYIEMKDEEVAEAGQQMSVDTYLDLVDRYETVHNSRPKQMVPAAFQTASLTPTTASSEALENDKQLKALKSHNFSMQKDLAEQIKTLHMAINNLTLQANQNATKRRRYNDDTMETEPTQPPPAQQQQQPYQQRQGYQKQNTTNPPPQNGPRPQNQNRADAQQQQQQQQQPQQPQEQTQQEEQKPKRQYYYRRPRSKIMKIEGKLYGTCIPCTSMHIIGEDTCPKNNPMFDVEIEEEEDQEEVNGTEEQPDEQPEN